MAPEAGTPDYWRARAAQVRTILEKTRNPQMREDLLYIIAGYERLAELAEKDRGPAAKDE